MKQLTQQQKRFVAEYIKTLDGELSAKNAGYKSPDLKAVSNNLLSNNFVIKEIKEQLKNQISSLRVQKGYVIQNFYRLPNFLLKRRKLRTKKEITPERKKLRDTSAGLKALESLCKYLGFNSENKDAEYRQARIITISNLDDEKI